jgi:hypothetical protein
MTWKKVLKLWEANTQMELGEQIKLPDDDIPRRSEKHMFQNWATQNKKIRNKLNIERSEDDDWDGVNDKDHYQLLFDSKVYNWMSDPQKWIDEWNRTYGPLIDVYYDNIAKSFSVTYLGNIEIDKKITETDGKHKVESESGRNMGEFDSEKAAKNRLRQIEYFKTKKAAVLETEFVQEYPQLVEELKEEMRFANLLQNEAEIKLAKKHQLPILDKLMGQGGQGRWIKMLKVAGPVTSTTAGIKTLPLYGRKKKKKDEEYVD